MTIFSGNPRYSGSWYKDHSLSLTLLAIFLIQAVIVWFSGVSEWQSDQAMHNQTTQLIPGYVVYWIYQMTVSLVADTYGALLIVVLGKFFYEKGSPSSNDRDEDD